MGLVGYAGLAALFAVIQFYTFKFELGRAIFPHKPDGCFQVQGLEGLGSEDIQLLPDGRALITSGLHLDLPARKREVGHTGQVFVFDYNHPRMPAAPVPIKGDLDREEFNPHGISIYVDPKTDEITVMIVNHPGEITTVEIFQFNKKKTELIFVKTVTHPAFGMLNDVHAISPTTFYATNYYYHNAAWLRKLETYLLLPLGGVWYYDGEEPTLQITGLCMPNGINVAKNGKYLYVTNGLHQQVRVYDIRSDHQLGELVQTYQMSTHADNLDVDDAGDIWTGAHPILWKVALHLGDPEGMTAPAQVVKIKTSDGLLRSEEEIYASTGEELSGTTTAVRYKAGLLIGTIYHNLVYCPLLKCQY